MSSYQGKKEAVKERIQILDQQAILQTASKGLKHLCLEIGMEVFHQILELDVKALAGPKGKHDPDRVAYRHGTEKTKVVLGGEKRQVDKPRVRSKEGAELPLESLSFFQQEDALNESMLLHVLCGVSQRKYGYTAGYGEKDSACTSKSEVQRRVKAGMEEMMESFFNRAILDSYPVIMIDGMKVGKMTVVASMGITEQGEKRMLSLLAGATENHVVVNDMLGDLIKRGLNPELPRLFVLDGAKALHKSVKDIFGVNALIQRCQVHKKRNVLSYLPESEQANISLALSKAYLEFDNDQAKAQLLLLAKNLERRYPDASNSLLEGLEETLTVHRLKVPGKLRKTLSNTNPMESANAVAISSVRKVSHWKDGAMILRHMAAAYLVAEKGFRRITGYRELPFLLSALQGQNQEIYLYKNVKMA